MQGGGLRAHSSTSGAQETSGAEEGAWTHCHHHPPQHSTLEEASWTLFRLLPPPRRTDPFVVSPLMVSPAARMRLRHHLLRVAFPDSELSLPQGSHKHEGIIQKTRRNGEHPHMWRKGRRCWSQPLPSPSTPPGLCPCPPSLILITLPLCLPNLSPVPTADGGEVALGSGPSPWQGAPGPWERKPAGQAQ